MFSNWVLFIEELTMINIRWDLAEQDLNDTRASIVYKDGKYYLCRDNTFFYDAPTKEMLIEAYYNHDLSDYTYPNNIKCECGDCHKEADYFECPGCLQTVGYCQGGSDEYSAYCTECWYILTTEDMNGPVIQQEKPNVYIN